MNPERKGFVGSADSTQPIEELREPTKRKKRRRIRKNVKRLNHQMNEASPLDIYDIDHLGFPIDYPAPSDKREDLPEPFKRHLERSYAQWQYDYVVSPQGYVGPFNPDDYSDMPEQSNSRLPQMRHFYDYPRVMN